MNSDQKKESETRVLRRERKRKKEGIKTEWKKTNGNGAEKKKKRGIETNRVRNARFSASIERFSLPSPRS